MRVRARLKVRKRVFVGHLSRALPLLPVYFRSVFRLTAWFDVRLNLCLLWALKFLLFLLSFQRISFTFFESSTNSACIDLSSSSLSNHSFSWALLIPLLSTLVFVLILVLILILIRVSIELLRRRWKGFFFKCTRTKCLNVCGNFNDSLSNYKSTSCWPQNGASLEKYQLSSHAHNWIELNARLNIKVRLAKLRLTAIKSNVARVRECCCKTHARNSSPGDSRPIKLNLSLSLSLFFLALTSVFVSPLCRLNLTRISSLWLESWIRQLDKSALKA